LDNSAVRPSTRFSSSGTVAPPVLAASAATSVADGQPGRGTCVTRGRWGTSSSRRGGPFSHDALQTLPKMLLGRERRQRVPAR